MPLPDGAYSVLGIDEWGVQPFLIETKGRIVTANLQSGEISEIPSPFGTSKQLSAVGYNEREQKVIAGTTDGHFSLAVAKYSATGDGEKHKVTLALEAEPFNAIGTAGVPIQSIGFGDAGDRRLVAAVQEVDGQKQLHVASLARKRSLIGKGKFQVDRTYELGSMLTGQPVQVLIPATADSVIALNSDGSVNYLFLKPDREFELRQTFTPFEDAEDPAISVMGFLMGSKRSRLCSGAWTEGTASSASTFPRAKAAGCSECATSFRNFRAVRSSSPAPCATRRFSLAGATRPRFAT